MISIDGRTKDGKLLNELEERLRREMEEEWISTGEIVDRWYYDLSMKDIALLKRLRSGPGWSEYVKFDLDFGTYHINTNMHIL